MKSIVITYEAIGWNGKKLERGEAAAKLEFLPDDTVKALVDSVGVKRLKMDSLTSFEWDQLDNILEALEHLRHRDYVNSSVKSIKVVS